MGIETVGGRAPADFVRAVGNDPARFMAPSSSMRLPISQGADSRRGATRLTCRGSRAHTFTCPASGYASARRFHQPSERQKTPTT
jgi:hypothetical protein